MAGAKGGLDEVGWHTLARDFVPAPHRHLPMLRVYLPFIDVDGKFVRWSEYVDVEEHSASLNWSRRPPTVKRSSPPSETWSLAWAC